MSRGERVNERTIALQRPASRYNVWRTSCCRFWANQLRVLLTAAAYVLMQELRLRAARTACARAHVTTLRERLLTLGVHVVRSPWRSCLRASVSPALRTTHVIASPASASGLVITSPQVR